MSKRASVSLMIYSLALLGVYSFSYQISPAVREAFGPLPGWSWDWLWAFDHFRYHRYGLAGLVGIAGAAVGLVLARRMPYLQRLAPLLRSGKRIGPFLLLAAGLAFWVFRAEYHSGDFIRLGEQLEQGKVFHMSQPLTTAAFYLAYSLLPGWQPYTAIALVNCLAGPLYLWALTRVSGEARAYRLVFWLLLALQTMTMLYFGYVEATAWSLAFAVLYVYTGMQTLRGRASLVRPSFLLGLTFALHHSYLYLGASWLVLLAYVLRRQAAGRGALGAAARAAFALGVLPVGIAVLALLLPDTIHGPIYGDALGGADSSILVPVTGLVQGAGGEYTSNTLFSAAHNAEVANLIFYISPLLPWLALATLATRAWPGGFSTDGERWFAAAIVVGAALFLWLWNPDLGMRYDFDLFGSTVFLTTLILAARLFRLLEARKAQFADTDLAAWTAALGVSAVNLAAMFLAFQPVVRLTP